MYAKDIRGGILKDTPDWATEFPLGMEVAVGEKDDPAWGIAAGYAEDPQIEYGRLNGKPFYSTEKGRFISIELYGGAQMLFPVIEVSPWKASKKEGSTFGKILCRLRLHAWEKRVPRRSPLRHGLSFLFFTEATQDGLQCCDRAGCMAQRKVTRWGVLSAQNGDNLRWRPVRK